MIEHCGGDAVIIPGRIRRPRSAATQQAVGDGRAST